MKALPLLLALAWPLAAAGNTEEEVQRAVQRALIQRDQQAAEFAARIQGRDVQPLRELHERQLRDAGRPLHPDPEVARHLRPYERQRLADERKEFVLRLPPPRVGAETGVELSPLPLPGGPQPGVEPVAPDGGRG